MPDQPGWYPDPAHADTARWWDGQRWTSQVRQATRPPVPAATAVPGWAAPPELPAPWKPGLVTGNLFSLLGVVLAVGYAVTLVAGHVRYLGWLPIVFGAVAYRLHERFAVPTLVLGALVLAGNLVALAVA